MLHLITGIVFGVSLTFMILDDYYKNKIIEYYEEREKNYHIDKPKNHEKRKK